MTKTLIVYGSKYGTTEEIMQTIALKLEQPILISPISFNSSYKEIENVIVASGIYSEQLHPKIIKFVESNREWLKSKQVGLLSISMGGENGRDYFQVLKDQLGNAVIWSAATKGRLILDKLTYEDNKRIRAFMKHVGMPIIDRDLVNPDEIQKLSDQIKDIFANS